MWEENVQDFVVSKLEGLWWFDDSIHSDKNVVSSTS